LVTIRIGILARCRLRRLQLQLQDCIAWHLTCDQSFLSKDWRISTLAQDLWCPCGPILVQELYIVNAFSSDDHGEPFFLNRLCTEPRSVAVTSDCSHGLILTTNFEALSSALQCVRRAGRSRFNTAQNWTRKHEPQPHQHQSFPLNSNKSQSCASLPHPAEAHVKVVWRALQLVTMERFSAPLPLTLASLTPQI
jgi:hypothetical protein